MPASHNGFAAVGLRPGERVALLVERDHNAIAAMLAATAYGSPYVPIDPSLPLERIEWMLQDAQPGLIVVNGSVREVAGTAPMLRLDDVAAGRPQLVAHDVEADDPAYIIYTSGTSGRPKGAIVSHGALAALMQSSAEVYGFAPGERMLQFHSFSFDASVEEVFAPLGAGATLVLRTDEMLGSARRLLREIDRLQVTATFFPTAYWHEIATEMIAGELALPTCLRMAAIGGEAVAPELVRSWKERYDGAMELLNGYGPTEVTVDCIVANLSQLDDPGTRSVTIGRPLPTVRAYVLDDREQPAPIGVPGELYLGGPQVGSGYLNRPRLTAERFITDPITGDGTVYRTGDRVRWRPDGNLEFLGRLGSSGQDQRPPHRAGGDRSCLPGS